MKFGDIAIVLFIMIFFLGCGSEDSAKATLQEPEQIETTNAFAATLRIAAEDSSIVVKPELFGTNLQWEHGGDDLVRVLGTQTVWNEQAVELTLEAGVSSLRFPGGALANTYQWKDGIGILSDRKSGITFGGALAPSLFGTDELITLGSHIDANLVITVNINAPVEDAKEWVYYINHQHPHHNINEPFAHYWEIGNEIYSPSEPGHTNALEYANLVNHFATQMKQVDPRIKIGAALEISFLQAAWMESVLPHMTTWNDEVLSHLSNDVDFLSLHFYAPFDKLPSSDDLAHLVLASPMVFAFNLNILEETLQSHQRDDIKIAITEYNTFFGDEIELDPRGAKPESALFQGLMLFEMIRSKRVVLANNWSLINNSVFGMIQTNHGDTITKRPSYPLFQAIAAQATNRLLLSSVESPGYSVNAIGNIPKIDHVPYLDVMVTQDPLSGDVIINVINRSLDESSLLTIIGMDDGKVISDVLCYSGIEAQQWQTPVKLTIDADETIQIPPFSYTRLIYQ